MIMARGTKKRPCCLVAAANPNMSPDHPKLPFAAKQRAAKTQATIRGSVKAVGAKRMLKGENAIRVAATIATARP
jgi:hypothetical protein